MFSQPTVFVIGAGASCEFGMPSGADLMKRVGSALNFRRGPDGRLLGDRDLFDILGRRFGSDFHRHHDGSIELSRLVQDAQFESIDEVLHWFSSNPEIVELGKATIVREILSAERGSGIVRNPNFIRTNLQTWVPHFISMAVGFRKKEEIEKAFSNVTIINFNYDRIIEHFVYLALQTKLGVSETEARDAVLSLKMIRPYGSIGALPWEGGLTTVPFGADLQDDHQRLFALSNNVQTYTERIFTRETLEDIESSLIGARLIVFLGFGFHQQNMSILKARDRAGPKQVLATVFGVDPENYENMQTAIFAALTCTSAPQLLPRKSVDLMITMKPTIMAPNR